MILIPEMKTWYGMMATFGTLGRFSKMPGTLGSMAACVIWIAFGGLPIWAIASVAILGTIAADRYEKAVEREDPPEVVIDEVAGCWTACWGFDPTYAIVGLFLFRIIDITKPFPVRQMEKLPGGIGIMADDIAGGIMANLLIRAMRWFFYEGGMETVLGLVGK
ncbi:MAG TPA: phosphatidylglycerophosphatase A [Synergistaceae bacterium]|jgi:phosphatidylglycerophosphatase A|nr:phosphatidylglycerophosphatase A [Synergistaceae bacterium]NLL41396.1 phosphatidylglycerophosphatase A [Synergistaceae bacterium]HPX03617.1 phosphatidylglycerophosphatase A [Synergistaceae bacterium]HQA54522.1 phosphatidylglycerophosphatase A [Synergistaceae bacterium]